VTRAALVGAERSIRICPRPRERRLSLELPPMSADAVAVMGAIMRKRGRGSLARAVASFSQAIATTEQEQRLRESEQKLTPLTVAMTVTAKSRHLSPWGN
jgi:hypothetical protein